MMNYWQARKTMTKLKVKLNRKTRRVEIKPQWICGKCEQEKHGIIGEAIPEHTRHCEYRQDVPASNMDILFGTFASVGNPCAIEFYSAWRFMRADYARFMKILSAEVI